jgi:hypothetical protein
MTDLINVGAGQGTFVMTLRDDTGTFDVALSAQTAFVLIAALAQAIVSSAEPNKPETAWLQWPATARSSDVSFDIDAIGPETIGIAVKLPGLMPITLEIPPESARQVAFALTEAANKTQIPETGKT